MGGPIGRIYSRCMLDVTRLRVLVAVARYGSVTAAARALNYAQPSVSHHLSRLEAETGTKLIQRAGRGIRLTDAAGLAERAAEVIGRLDAAENELAAYTGLRAGRLRLAAFPSALGTIVPAAAAMLREYQPGVDLRLTEAEPPEALRMLRAGYVDVALVFRYSPDTPSEGGQDAPARTPRPTPAQEASVAAGNPPAEPGMSLPDEGGGIDHTEGLRERLLLDEQVHLVTSAQAIAEPSADLAGYARYRWIAGCDRCRANLLRQCALAGSPRRSRSPPTTTSPSRRWWQPTWGFDPAGTRPARRTASRDQDRAAPGRPQVRVRGGVRRPARPSRGEHAP